MKIRFKVNKRFNTLVTVTACVAAIWMMVVRFDYPVEKVFEILWICLLAIVVILAVTAPLALLIRWLMNRKTDRLFDEFRNRPSEPESESEHEESRQ